MTIICYDGKTLAADRRHVTEGGVRLESRDKLIRSGSGAIAACGQSLGPEADLGVLEKVANGERKSLGYDGHALVLLADGRAFNIQSATALVITQAGSIGSGYEVALGAMAAGKSAVEAAHIACDLIVTCGDGVDSYTPEQASFPRVDRMNKEPTP